MNNYDMFRKPVEARDLLAQALESPGKPVLKLRLVCMGHEPDLKAELEKRLQPFEVEIKAFYPFNLMKKLSLQKSKVGEWRELVESVMIDFNYDGVVFEPSVVDIPEDNAFVKGEYAIPDGAGKIRVKITDLLAESFEMEVKRPGCAKMKVWYCFCTNGVL